MNVTGSFNLAPIRAANSMRNGSAEVVFSGLLAPGLLTSAGTSPSMPPPDIVALFVNELGSTIGGNCRNGPAGDAFVACGLVPSQLPLAYSQNRLNVRLLAL